MQSREELGYFWQVPTLPGLVRRVAQLGITRRRCRKSGSDETGPQRQGHRTGRIGWLRAAVLGANDGIVSTASLVVGVAAAGTTRQEILLAGIAGMVAGALSMAAGEYVSVSSQADTERAELELERAELAADRESEERELAYIVAVVSGASLMCLAALGALSARVGGAPAWLGTARVTFWGAAAMAATAAVGALFGTAVR
jgi:vacuolar iron transporter family protein